MPSMNFETTPLGDCEQARTADHPQNGRGAAFHLTLGRDGYPARGPATRTGNVGRGHFGPCNPAHERPGMRSFDLGHGGHVRWNCSRISRLDCRKGQGTLGSASLTGALRCRRVLPASAAGGCPGVSGPSIETSGAWFSITEREGTPRLFPL
jgi:hypothetical protein